MAARSAEAMTGRGILHVSRDRATLRAGSIVQVRGSAKPFEGLFAVGRVRHVMTSHRHDQEFELVRAGIGAQAPRGRPAVNGFVASTGRVGQVTIVTPGRQAVVISDLPGPMGGVSLRASTGARISVTNDGIVIDNGQGASIALTRNRVHVTGVIV